MAQADLYIHDAPYQPQSRTDNSFSRVSTDDALIIDNGSSSFRAGFASHSSPYINTSNQYARYKSKQGHHHLLFGSDTEIEAASRAATKPTWEGDILLQPDGVECALDYSLSKLSRFSDRLASGSNGIAHPVVMSERLGTPLHSRAIMSELLFEGYSAPSVAYGVDGMFAFSGYYNRQSASTSTLGGIKQGKDGIVLNMGHYSTSVIPVLDGKGVMSRAKRIPWGGAQAAELGLRLAQLKYPNFPTRVTLPQATYMYHETAYFSQDYQAELESLADPKRLADMGKIIQFEYPEPEIIQKTEEEIAAAEERKQANADRLRAQVAAKRAETAAKRESDLAAWQEMKASKEEMHPIDFQDMLEESGFETVAALDRAIKNVETAIKRSAKLPGDADEEEDEIPTFPLVSVPDSELDDEGKKEKKKQKLLKASYEARLKIKAEKLAEKERQEEEKQKDEDSRIQDPTSWAAKKRDDHQAIISRIKERAKKKLALTNRKTVASQARMKTISNLASDDPPPKRKRKEKDDDDFGADDDDWAVYREIDGGEDSEAEREDAKRITELESLLLSHDPSFHADHTFAAQSQKSNALINAFIRSHQKLDTEDIAQAYQIHLNVERIRIPETWFQPVMAGVDSAGLGEVAGWLLNGFSYEERLRMMQCIYVTGGSSLTPNITDRLHRELTALLPYQAPIKICSDWPGDARVAAWQGMASWSKSEEGKASGMTRAEWHEKGGDYMKEHSWSNWVDES